MEMCGSTAWARRCSSSTSGWSWASDSTRAITRRCSVMRMPFSIQSFSMRSDTGLSRIPSKIGLSGGDVKVEAHDQGVHISFRAAVVVGLAQARPRETQALVEADGGGIVDSDFQESLDGAEVAGHGQGGGHQRAGHAPAAGGPGDPQGQHLHLAGGDAAEDDARRLSVIVQGEEAEDALAIQQVLEFVVAPRGGE